MINLFRSFLFALSGIAYALRFERNFRIEWLCGLVVLMMATLVPFTDGQATLLIVLIAVVLAFELFNSAVEKLCDSTGLEFSLAKKRAKDLAAAAVFVVACGAATMFLRFVAAHTSNIMTAIIMNPWAFLSIPLVLVLSLPSAFAPTPLRSVAFAAGFLLHALLVVNHHEELFFSGGVLAFHLVWAIAIAHEMFRLKIIAKADA